MLYEGQEDKTAMGDIILWNENTTFVRDFYELLWDIWDRELKRNLYLVVQYLEVKENLIPSFTSNVSRELIEREYDLAGYGIVQLNDEFGKFIFGTFTVPLFEGPIYVEELLDKKKTIFTLKITVQQPGEIVHPMAAPKPTTAIPDHLRKQLDSKKAKLVNRQKKRDNIKKAEEDLKKRREGDMEDKSREEEELKKAKTPKSSKKSKKGADGAESPKKTPRKML